jgi:hypothetical protein
MARISYVNREGALPEVVEPGMIVARANLTNRFTGPPGLEFEYPDKSG